jgi:fumarate reductase flavoprotein subunit
MKKLSLIMAATLMAFSAQGFAATEYTADLVIVGAGTAGLPAAARAAELGVKTITIEKTGLIGGQLHVIEGTYAVGTPLQRKEMVGLTTEKSFEQTMNYAVWRADPALVKRIVDSSASKIKWLMDNGVAMKGLITDTVDGNRVYHTYQNHFPGQQAVGALMKVVNEKGGKVLTDTAGKKLITNQKGEVTGIIAQSRKDGEIRINAKAVLLAAGSMSHNAELMARFNPKLLVNGKPMQSIALPGNTGDGVKMGLEVGAAVDNTDIVIGESIVPTNTDYAELHIDPKMLDAYMILKAQTLWVNTKGQRFMDESRSADFTTVLNAIHRHGNQAFVIMDDAKRQDLMNGKGSDTNYFTLYDTGRKVVHFDKVVADGQKRGYAFKANTIKELAMQMGVDPDTLQATYDRYNALAKSGTDTDFGKKTNLYPLLKAPFYAFKGDGWICDMTGGLLINSKAQVISTKGTPIKGLYAAGSMAGGMYGTEYPYINPGFASATAIATGHFAVEDVAEKLKQSK